MFSRSRLLWWSAALLFGVVVMAWLGLPGFAWNDYDGEAAPAFKALTDGDLKRFLELSPSYGGSFILRAPFAWATGVLGGGELAVYRAVSIPCLVAGAMFGMHLVDRMRGERASVGSRVLVLGLAVANPITLRALEMGHPEELLCAVLAIAAVLASARERDILAAVLLGFAIATKAWAVLAIAPVLLATPSHHIRLLAIAGVIPVVVMAPLLLAGNPEAVVVAATQTAQIFTPWQVFWFLGEHGAPVLGTDNLAKPGYRTAPEWLSPFTHPGIALLTVPAGVLWWWRHRASRVTGEQTLVLLALLFLLRCMLDPWNSVYYELPLILTLLAWEVTCRSSRPPVLTLATTVLTWATFEWSRTELALSPDAQCLMFLAWALPLCALLSWEAFRAPQAAEKSALDERPDEIVPLADTGSACANGHRSDPPSTGLSGTLKALCVVG